MIERDDLKAAVGSGLISEAQAAGLASLADSRRGARQDLAAGDEPFELFRGFNEIFIVVGMVILAIGWGAIGVLFIEGGNYFSRTVAFAVAGAVLVWLLSEYFIRRRRMVAPAITLSILWSINASAGFSAEFSQPFMVAQQDFSSLPLPLALTTLSLVVYWFRFRVPFAMAMIALGAFGVALVWASTTGGSPDSFEDLFLLSAGGRFAWITLLIGLIVFGVAMAFDMSDPHRVTRRSANGFWLHVVAAPALVNTLALTLLTGDAFALLAIVLGIFALIAVVIDRRSFLITAVGYCVTLAFTVFGGDGGAFTIFALGLALLLLGAFWEKLRSRLLRLLGPVLPLSRLPPSV
ncbi:hypothetical protein JQU17_19215 [Ponticoccus sp. SC2-23]|uniref:hypothetical protein n=1 Tax=Alexandriicola marinus TaxID=2081710 RepID=UPI000FD9A1BE|nr:hypothetical protein [Alexandriicola marinus]MBM1220739.1 hypothetical protein [Ponticoccus sp. SC6-9]MBM1225998.1 hypothetical protein [Ponticoccus sp. SC6-15]MBM1231295.1 hypothetical protein [Ponticoccus sp. SC6-38]MBM1235844.1 hypothetical protein [Ponticoccus sp. SC6-45]MBM1240318.1 hypothetical protein [Ponticoccus sp. SC6-49]MBM1244853.1 hypothetical protein [Ponticoccus sp. SC2-64]MBM1249318.1 hypothetical protein [Ponticoccus sp. SC6-42]MBM1252394.1 hypothetical protein [Pontico